MTETKGKVVSVNGNLVSVRFDGNVSMSSATLLLTVQSSRVRLSVYAVI